MQLTFKVTRFDDKILEFVRSMSTQSPFSNNLTVRTSRVSLSDLDAPFPLVQDEFAGTIGATAYRLLIPTKQRKALVVTEVRKDDQQPEITKEVAIVLYFTDRALAERVSTAIAHAVKLTAGSKKSEPF